MHFLEEFYREYSGPIPPLDRETYARTGSRLEFEAAYFARRKRLSAAALLYLKEGGEEYLAAANGAAEAVLSEPTWVHPAHGGAIDLFCAETGFLLAELAATFPFPPALKERIGTALHERIIEPFRTQNFGWERGTDNWLAVCMGNIAGTLFYADGVEFSRQKARLKGGLLRYIESFPADGWCAEGLEYWNFGFGAFVRFAELCFPDLLDRPKARAVAAYPQTCFLRGNVTASFSDCPPHGKADRGLVNFLHKRYGLPLLTAEQTAVRTENCAYLPLSRGLRDGFSVAETGHAGESGIFGGGTVAVFHRKKYSLAVKAGSNGEKHNHNDVGAFILSAGGGQILADLGQPLYDRDYFSDKRYSNLAASSLGHSVPIVNGKGQCAGGEYGGTLSSDGLSVEFAGAYEGCGKLERRFTLLEDGVKVADEFSEEDEICERFVCPNRTAARAIVSEEGLPPRLTETFFYAHDGTKTPVFLVDFPVPRGRKSAAFCVFVEK